MDLFAHALPKEPYGYECHACTHLWDALAPCGKPADVMAALKQLRTGHCPSCGVLGEMSLLKPERYAQRKVERAVAGIAGAAAA